ncbi:hypothetical protein M885DRAFT_234555 [Pelagophyceae sp. CCMP2097]|nr:hypothetical protein M885DRAFT_234555 [Pelagophyceae sp. CCMP2097]
MTSPCDSRWASTAAAQSGARDGPRQTCDQRSPEAPLAAPRDGLRTGSRETISVTGLVPGRRRAGAPGFPGRESLRAFRVTVASAGAENGLVGVVFAYGMGAQCEAVAAVVKAARCALGATATMQLNVVGLSRGAVSALAVAAMLGQRPEAFSGGGAGDYDGTKPEALSSLNKRASKSPPPVAAEAAGHAQTAAAPADQSTSGRGATADEASGGDASTSRWTKWLQPAAWSAPSAEAAVPPPAAAPRRVRVVVPAGMHPGDDVNFVVDGRTLRAKIPIQLSKRGDQRTFDVVVPPGRGGRNSASTWSSSTPCRATRS